MSDKTPKPTAREDDYRDYEERDLADGWPYADGDARAPAAPANGAYGETGENFDETENPGFQTASEPAIDATNGIDVLGDEEQAETEDDGLEETVFETLDAMDVDLSSVEIKVRRGVVHLEGSVETPADSALIKSVALQVPGISAVRNRLTANAADGMIPNDWDE